MAVALDASTPARFTGTVSAGGSITSASFTAPANALIEVDAQFDGDNDGHGGTSGISDTGGLSWTKRVERTLSETTAGGGSVIWTARTTSSASRTVSVTRTGGSAGALRWSAKVRVWTGADVDGTPVDTVGANNEGGSGTNNLTTSSVTPGAAGVLVVSGTDWNALGTPASSDLTADAAHYAGSLSVVSGYKACSSGVSVTGNLDASGTSAAQWKWCQVVVREAAGGGGGTTPKNVFGKVLSGPFGGVI